MRKNLVGVCALVAVFLPLAGCTSASAGTAQTLQGVVELDTVTLAFEVGGRVEAIAAEEGDHVEGKVVLARLDESLARPDREARAAELEAAKAQLALLEAGARREDVRATEAQIATLDDQAKLLARQRARQVELTQSGAAPTAKLDEYDAQATSIDGQKAVLVEKLKALRSGARKQEIEAARAKVEALEAALLATDVRLTRYALTYEGSADVLEKHVKVGEVVAPGAPAFTLADLDHPFVDVFVPEAEITSIKLGMPMAVRIDALTTSMPGRVERIHHKTEFTPRFLFSEKERANLVIRVRVRIDDPQHVLRAGVPAFVSSGHDVKSPAIDEKAPRLGER